MIICKKHHFNLFKNKFIKHYKKSFNIYINGLKVKIMILIWNFMLIYKIKKIKKTQIKKNLYKHLGIFKTNIHYKNLNWNTFKISDS